MSLLEVRHLTKRIGNRTILDNISLSVESGEFFTLVGPSGCGKTTLLRQVGGFSEPDAGEVLFEGTSLAGVPPECRPIHTVFQSYALFPHMTVAGNIAFPLRMQRVPRDQIARRLSALLQDVQLRGYERHFPHELSGGQRQRVAIARALAASPRLLLLDEPLSALDAALQTQMQHELIALQQQLGVAFVYVTHDQTHALALSQRIAVMHEGRIVQVDTPETIYRAPATRFVAGFIGSCNLLEATVEGRSHNGLQVRVKGIGTLQVPAAAPLKVGTEGTVAVRPEQILIRGIQPTTGRDKAAKFPLLQGTIRDRLYQGDVTLYLVELNSDCCLQAMVPNGGPAAGELLARGDRVELGWPEKVGIFLSR
uniref:ABC transporter ATP-binding protein n=1 Tax=Cupriavidus necator TaxID=106590 RepID=UPI003F497995